MAWELRSQAVGQVKLHVTAIELMRPRVCAPEQEKTEQWKAHAPKLEFSPHSMQLEKANVTARPSGPIKSMNKR